MSHVHHQHVFLLESPQPGNREVKGVCECGAITEGLSQIDYLASGHWHSQTVRAKGKPSKR